VPADGTTRERWSKRLLQPLPNAVGAEPLYRERFIPSPPGLVFARPRFRAPGGSAALKVSLCRVSVSRHGVPDEATAATPPPYPDKAKGNNVPAAPSLAASVHLGEILQSIEIALSLARIPQLKRLHRLRPRLIVGVAFQRVEQTVLEV